MELAELNEALEQQFAPWVLQLDLEVTQVDDSGVVLRMQPSAQLNRTGDIICGQALIAAADTAMVLAIYQTISSHFLKK